MKKLEKVLRSESLSAEAAEKTMSVVKLLLKDHRAFRKLMNKIRSPRTTVPQAQRVFVTLKALIKSHVAAEEHGLLRVIMENPRFEDKATEGYEEHRVHEYVLKGIQTVRSPQRKVEQMKAFCEILEHHLDEEEEDLFPRVKKTLALSSQKKLGKRFLRKRASTRSPKEKLGASKVILKKRKV